MISVRAAVASDYDAYARLFAELGVDDPVATREWFVGQLAARMIVAAHGSDVVGYALFEVLAETGYVRNVVSDPMRRRTGIGAALMAALRDLFRARGATSWCLNVKPDNAAAIGLYERFGMRRAYSSTALRVARETVLPAPVDDVVLVTSPPHDDAHVEAAFGLLSGQLASARTKPHRQVLQVHRGDALAGIAVFTPTIPGAFPFRLSDLEVAATALARLRALAPADAAFLQVVVEDDGELRDAVLAAGGYVQLELLHMRGTL